MHDQGSEASQTPRPASLRPSDAKLFARWQDGSDERAREELVERYLPLARQLARRYQRADEPMEDLVQVASLGLLKAIDRFDAGREIYFSSYAVPTILGELKRHFRDRTWSVRVPRDLQERALRVDRTITELSLSLHRSPTVREIAAATTDTEEQVLEAIEAAGAYRASSLDAPRGTQEDSSTESLAEALGGAEEGFDAAEQRAILSRCWPRSPRASAPCCACVSPRTSRRPRSAHASASRRWVSRLIRQSLARLRSGLQEPAGEPAREDQGAAED